MGRLLVVDYVRPQDSRPEGVVFVFDGGVLEADDLARLVFADGEVVSVAFCDPVEVRQRTKALLADRLAVAVDAAGCGETALCEQGHRIA